MDYDTKTVDMLNVGDHITIIDEAVKVIAIRPNYLRGRTYVMFEYIHIPKPQYGNAVSWLLFKPSDIVKRAEPLTSNEEVNQIADRLARGESWRGDAVSAYPDYDFGTASE